MATIKVNTAIGSDANDGSSPVVSLRHALALASAGDKVEMTSTAKNPIRTFMIDPTVVGGGNLVAYTVAAAIRFGVARGTLGLGAYVTTGVDVSEGGARGNLLHNADFEQWSDANTPMHWSKNIGTETWDREATEVNSGTYALKMSNGGSTAFGGVEQSVWLPASCRFRFTYSGNMPDIGTDRQWIAKIWDRVAGGSVMWDWINENWGADDTDAHLKTSVVDAWQTLTDTFVPQNTGRHTLKISTSGGTTQYGYLDGISITNEDYPTYAWTLDTGNTYVLPMLHFRPYRVLICSNTDWDAMGYEAFATETQSNYPFVADVATCRTTEQSAAWSGNALYVHLPAGLTPADVHIEAIPLGAAFDCDEDAVISGIGITGTNGIRNPSGATIPDKVRAYGVKAIGCAASYIASAGEIETHLCDSYNTSWDAGGATITEGDYLALGSTVTAYGGKIVRGCEDGMQADAGGTITGIGVLAIDGGTNPANADETHAFKIGNNGSNSGTFKYCTAKGYTGIGFRGSDAAAAGSVFTVEQCIAEGNNGGDFSLPTNANVTYTCNENIGGTYLASGAGGSGAWEGGTNNQSVQDADIASVGLNSDGSIQSDSPGIDTGAAIEPGSLWLSGSPRLSAAFGPFPNRKLNKGADQR